MPVQWIDYKGYKILHADYRGLVSEDKMLANLETEGEFYKNATTKILSLNDYRDTFLSKAFMDKVTQLGKLYKNKTGKSAILGITGLKNVLFNAYAKLTGEHAQCFNDEISAKEFLIKP